MNICNISVISEITSDNNIFFQNNDIVFHGVKNLRRKGDGIMGKYELIRKIMGLLNSADEEDLTFIYILVRIALR